MNYYAQAGEDINLRKFFPEKENGFYIDVGIWDHQVDSVTKHFYDCGWTGINIEPVAEYHEQLVVHRPRDLNLNYAVGSQKEMRKFYHIHKTGLGTFSIDNALMKHNETRRIESRYVQTLTLKEICETYLAHGTEIEFLKIDVEGWEAEVLRGADFVNYRPKIILYEATVPMTTGESAIMSPVVEECDRILQNASYVYLDFDGLNKWYRSVEFFPPMIGAHVH